MSVLQTFWNRVTAPPDSVQHPGQRRQAQFISSALLIVISLTVIVEAGTIIAYAPEYTSYWITLLTLPFLIGTYLLSRSRHYLLAAWITVGLFIVAIFAATLLNPDAEGNPISPDFLYFLTLPILISSSVLSLRGTIIVVATCLIIILAFPILLDDPTILETAITQLSFLPIISGFIYALTRYRDLLERDRQRELAEKEERYRTLLETTYEGICVYANRKILDANPGFARMFGYDSLEIIGTPVLDLVPEEMRDLITRNMENTFERSFEAIGLRKDSSKFHVELIPKTQTWRGNTVGVLAVRDITERVLVEEALRDERSSLAQRVSERTAALSIANAELARAARLKDEFLANMSHELRTPLNAILGMSEVLQAELCGPLNIEQVKSVNTIAKSGDHLLNLINDILDVSKIEAGQMDLRIRLVEVEPICQASLQLVKQQSYKKRLSISSTFDSTVTTLRADERRLKQILVNLLSNAVKFTPKGGEIGLEVASDMEKQVVYITVWDTGIGIAPDDMKRLFGGPKGPQPFVQLDSKLSRQYEGTGLGLSLVYRLTEMQRGSVSVESEVGKGSRFTISLPWQPPDGEQEIESEHPQTAKQKPSSQAADSRRQSTTILLAEDNETNIEAVSTYLLAMGYRVILALNGIEAIKQTQEHRPDVILMDVQMPGMDGLQATRRIRADADLAQIPIIALTALAMPGDRERCLEAGVDEYMPKPINLAELIQTIEAQIERKRED